MADDERVNSILVTLPDGALVLSTILTHELPPGHVYRVVSKSGTILREFSTLIDLTTFLSRYSAASGTGGNDPS